MTGLASVVGAAAEVTLSKLLLSANELSLEVGDSSTLTATGVYSDGTTKNLTALADWSGEKASVATVYNGTITAKSEGSVTIVAAYGDLVQSVQVTVTKKVKALTKDTQILNLRKNESGAIKLTATYSDNSTQDVASIADWSSSNEKVATVLNGSVTGISSGSATVTATLGKKTVTIDVNVELVNRIAVNKSKLSLLLTGSETVVLTATYPDGTTKDVTADAKWSSSDDQVADALKGVITGYAAGTAVITASYGTKTTSITVDVDKTIALNVDQDSIFLHIKGTPQQLKVTAQYADGRNSDITSDAEWTSSDETVAYVSNGLVTGYKSGSAVITAKYNGKSVDIDVDVEVVNHLDVSPVKVVMSAGDTGNLALIATYADGKPEDITEKADWSSDNEDVAYASKGLITAYKSGTAQISGSYGGKTIKVTVYVDVPSKLTTSSKEVNVEVNGEYQATLTAVYSDDSTAIITSKAKWTTSDEAIAEVEAGKITGLAEGTATITADYNGVTAKITVKVGLAKELEANVTLVSLALNDTEQITLEATDASGKVTDVTADAKWSSSRATIADVKKGLVKAIAKGTATITATYGGQSAAIAVEVDQITRIEASVFNVSLKSGKFEQIAVTVTYNNGKIKDVTALAEWKTSNYLVATAKSGKIMAVGYGKASISATYAGKTVKVPIDVDTLKYFETSEVSLTLTPGKQVQVISTATYADQTEADVSKAAQWASSKVTVATAKDGIIKATGKGKATITVSFAGKKAKILVTVN
ncbi:Ig-like domain-containing protein [Paenibacillus sepulcri]|uniref:Ig-like domain-containing protein n=2 Tax=Paenibacillus sepulcri TaxID=359917 RepID=A0ABS7C2W5_9BACL|nr:Ig-like domain-containing protein [Paenibacillus sepulcri]